MSPSSAATYESDETGITKTGYRRLRTFAPKSSNCCRLGQGRTQSRESLLFDVFQNPTVTRTVDSHIRRLREKLEKHTERLEAIRAEGYLFSAVSDPFTH